MSDHDFPYEPLPVSDELKIKRIAGEPVGNPDGSQWLKASVEVRWGDEHFEVGADVFVVVPFKPDRTFADTQAAVLDRAKAIAEEVAVRLRKP